MHYLSPTAPWHCKCTVELYECPDHQYISNDIGDEEHADALDDAAFYWVAALWTWVTSAVLSAVCVTKRRNSWACIGDPNPEQETIKDTHAQETPAYQRRPTTQHAAQGSNPPIRALHMQLAKIPHTHQTTPPATVCYKETQ